MDKKGQIGIGAIMVVFIGVIVGVILFQLVSQEIGGATSTHTESVTAFTAPTTTQTLTGQDLLSTAVVVNQSGGINCANNYTISEGVSETTGTKRVLMSVGAGDKSLCTALNYSYTYGPEGYISSGAGRSIALLIPIFAALAIAVLALMPTLKGGVLNLK